MLLSACLTAISLSAFALAGPSGGADSALIIYDTSGSMAWTGKGVFPRMFQAPRKGPLVETGMTPPTRLEHASDVASSVVDGFLKKHYDMGLIVFGQGGCGSVELMVQLGGSDPAGAIRSVLFGLKPTGATPLSSALDKAAEYIRNGGYQVREVVLITDGIETCKGDPKKSAAELSKTGAKLKIIGLDIPPALASELEGVAEAGSGSYEGQSAVGYGGDTVENIPLAGCPACTLVKAARMSGAPPPSSAVQPSPPPAVRPPLAPPPTVWMPPAGGIFPDDDGSRLKQ